MFLGHYGVGFASKQPGKSISLGTLFMAAQWLDLLWPIFLILGIEHVTIHPGDTKLTPLNFDNYPFSHSLLFVLIWSILFGVIYFLRRRNLRNSIIVSLLVLSHWLLDLIVHRPDLPLYPRGPLEGFSLWNSPIVAVTLEFVIFVLGIIIYLALTKSKDKIGVYSMWGLIIFLAGGYIANLFGPPPPDLNTLSYGGLIMWILIPWAYWVDRHRISKTG